MFFNYLILFYTFIYIIRCKYIEGELKTSEKWAFLARFCFLSEEGQFEYQIDYNEDQGDPNLLLYYDTEDQWQAVYKSNKSCEEKESVLNVKHNQIINLTTRYDRYRDLSGCMFIQTFTPSPTYTLIMPTLPTYNKSFKNKVTVNPLSNNTNKYYTESTSYFTSSTTQEYETISTVNTQEKSLPETSEIVGEAITTTTETPSIIIKKRSINNKDRFVRKGRNVMCYNARRFRSSRERWWFIAISNCNGTKGIHIKYKFLMTNGAPGDYWHEHFSADEFYILPVLMAFIVAYSFLFMGIVICTIELKSRQLLHTTYKIFVFSVIVQMFGILFISSCYIKLAISGFVASKMRRFGQVLTGTSETSFLLLLLLLAKGFTVTRGQLPVPASIKLTVFMCLYAVTYISIFIYEAEVFDPGEVLYLYESPAGYGLITLRIIAWCMFIYSTIFTLKRYPEKGNFYYPFNVFGTLWFVAGPAFILSANTYIDKWVRESVVCAVLLFISFGGHLMFLILTMPAVANKNFPYHVRTTQIGIMEMTGRNGTSTIDQFGHHIYEPTTNYRETVIIPLTRRTEELFQGMYHQTTFRTDSPAEELNQSDKTIDNVLNWSAAKNISSMELPLNTNVSPHSRSDTSTDISFNNDNNKEVVIKSNQSYDEFIREVPIELFTVSKMIVTQKGSK